MKIDPEDFQAHIDAKVHLDHWPTLVKPVYQSKKKFRALLEEQMAELSELQRLLYAFNRHAVLVIFQAMDAAGKDGAIRHVMSGVNPQGCQVFSFQHPSVMELEHNFLWRTTQCLPERGWYVVPADDKENARLIIPGIVLDTFKSLEMRYPKTNGRRRVELVVIRRRLASEDPSSASQKGAGSSEVQP